MAQHRPSRFRFEDYRVGIICALPKELLAIRALFDETHEGLRTVKEDTMHYSLGRMGRHLVTTACLPSGEYGTNASSAAMQNMRRTFPQLESCLFVGIGGGVPSSENDIRLGDVVVSHPVGRYPAVVQYDMGKMMPSGIFETTGTLHPPPQLLMTAIAGLRSDPNPNTSALQESLNKIGEHWPLYRFPGRDQDVLFAAHSPHLTTNNDCRYCQGTIVDRPERVSDEPQIFYGPIGSGNQVIKSAEHRDLLREKHKILCFEMEAAGVMNIFSCLIIRGICDYADSHKGEGWQEYAAATAAAYTKLLLSVLRDHNDIVENMGPCCQVLQSAPIPIISSDNQRTTLTDDLSSNHNDICISPTDDAESLGPQNPPQELIDRSAVLQAFKPERDSEEVLQQCFLLSRRSPSWNPWPKDRDSFQLFQSLSRWISDPECFALIVRGMPGRLLHEHPESEIFASSVIQVLRQRTDFPVIWALSPGGISSRPADIMKAIISQGLPLCSRMSPLPTLLLDLGQCESQPTEEQLFGLVHEIIGQLPSCFIVIEIKTATLAGKMKSVVERAVQTFEGNLNPKILLVGYDIPWGKNPCRRVQNSIMPSIRLRGSQPGWDPCWNNLKPRFS